MVSTIHLILPPFYFAPAPELCPYFSPHAAYMQWFITALMTFLTLSMSLFHPFLNYSSGKTSKFQTICSTAWAVWLNKNRTILNILSLNSWPRTSNNPLLLPGNHTVSYCFRLKHAPSDCFTLSWSLLPYHLPPHSQMDSLWLCILFHQENKKKIRRELATFLAHPPT